MRSPRSLSLTSLAFPLLLTFVSSIPTALAQSDVPLNEDGTPKRNILGYIPNKSIAAAAAAIYGVTFLVLMWRYIQYRYHVMLYLIIGCLTYAAGMGIRVAVSSDPYTLGPYISSTLLVLLSPVFFILTDYMLFGRIVRALDMEHYLLIRGRWISRIFVTSDGVTFFLQCSGGGLQATEGMATLGTTITLIGIIAQLVSFVAFIIVALHWAYKIRKHEPQLWYANGGGNTDWKRLFWALMYTCIGFLIRSFFRSVELSQGHTGYLATHEGYLYCLDSLPLLLAIIAYVFYYPGMFLGPKAIHPVGTGSLPMSSPGSKEEYPLNNGSNAARPY
ncbi:RTA1 like protein-domain-containing protein [Mrakia frigida]|uniref:RTA1 domain-containing protein n=1 Tax=Mrakia frigida TaxID=29902 RepID=UPI003FCBF551